MSNHGLNQDKIKREGGGVVGEAERGFSLVDERGERRLDEEERPKEEEIPEE